MTRNKVQAGIDKLKEALKGNRHRRHQGRYRTPDQDFYAVSEGSISRPTPGRSGGAQTVPTWAAAGRRRRTVQYYDADYKVVDDDDQNKK